MRTDILNSNRKLYLNINDIASALSINKESAKVTASRYVEKGILIRLKRDFYTTKNKFENLTEEELFKLANIIQTPSYISLVSALSYYNISTQQQRNFIESVSLKRTKQVKVIDINFSYSRIKGNLYEGFELNNYFIAKPNKALADIVYLTSLGKYSCDFNAINFKKINTMEVSKFLEKSNNRAIKYWSKLCSIYGI